jgi:hypothetical protein
VDRTLLLAKSAKGLEEVKARTHGLPQKLRAEALDVLAGRQKGQRFRELAAAYGERFLGRA